MMLIPVSEQVFVPIHRVERISFFGGGGTIKYIDQREVERINEEDAKRLMAFVLAATAGPTPCKCKGAKR